MRKLVERQRVRIEELRDNASAGSPRGGGEEVRFYRLLLGNRILRGVLGRRLAVKAGRCFERWRDVASR